MAKELGQVRTELKNKNRKKKHDRGKLNEKSDEGGVLGELVGRHYVCCKGLEHKCAPLISLDGPVSRPDITVGSCTIDCKLVRDQPDCLVNVDAHNDPKKKVSHYLFVKLTAGQCSADIFMASHAEVSKWPKKWCKYSDAHYFPVCDLPTPAPSE
jgi:hypothetical protein